MVTKKDIKEGRVFVTPETFKKVFAEQYNLLYDSTPEVEKKLSRTSDGIRLLDAFDALNNESSVFRLLARLCCNIRQDFFTSDRECVAFIRTIDILGVKIEC